jgi:lipopolysaccharide transport system ATP-binding protein
MEPAITIQNLSKKYTIQNASPYIALRDVITKGFKDIFRSKGESSSFWALKDIDLEIEQGERVGIIGRNGAGKSTLLKLISRITSPTTGKIILNGRVASLLEVGTGFHPELTGRENIYLNGSILGLTKKEIDKKLDEIIDFSGVETFIDSPLKFYSSGMELRLAFSVAAFLEPEILLIDEVLAVGDIEFQKKCLGKMEDVSKSEGRTILFVSHNMNYISSLCNKGILLEKGRLVKSGNVSEVISEYITNIANRSANFQWIDNKPGNDIVRLCSIRMIDKSGTTTENFKVNEQIGIEMRYEVMQDGHILWLGYNIHNQEGINVFDTHSVNSPYYHIPHEKGSYVSTVWIPENLLNTGRYIVSGAIFNHLKQVIHFHEKDVLLFTVYDIFDQETARGMSPGDFPGVVRPLLPWTIQKMNK